MASFLVSLPQDMQPFIHSTHIILVVCDKVCDEEIMTNDDNLESNLLTSSLLKRRLVYMLVQDELTREQAIHQNNLIMQWEDKWQL